MTGKEINNDYKPLIVRDIVNNKSPKLAKSIPGFLYKYLHKTLEIDQVNEILRLHGHKKKFDFAQACVEMFNVKIEEQGKENLPDGGPFIFVSNHPLGGFDGGMIVTSLGKRYDKKLRILVNDILTNVPNMEGVFVPINKHGSQASDNVRMLEEIYNSDNHVVTFPAGLVSRRKKGLIRDPEWQKNFVSKSVQHERDVIPVHISGRCTNFFYNLSNIRKMLGIKANIEMFYLPRETFKHKNNTYTITYGKPISYKTFTKEKRPIEWAQLVKNHVYTLPENPNSEFKII